MVSKCKQIKKLTNESARYNWSLTEVLDVKLSNANIL
jgi:hypothetical protein